MPECSAKAQCASISQSRNFYRAHQPGHITMYDFRRYNCYNKVKGSDGHASPQSL